MQAKGLQNLLPLLAMEDLQIVYVAAVTLAICGYDERCTRTIADAGAAVAALVALTALVRRVMQKVQTEKDEGAAEPAQV